MLIQEGQTVGWDPRFMWDGPDLVTRIFLFYLLGLCVTHFIRCARLWRALGWRSDETWQVLDSILEHIGKSDFLAATKDTEKISVLRPEVGLRIWSSLPTEADARARTRSLERAQTGFRYAWENLQVRVSTLRRSVSFTLLLGLLLLAIEASRAFGGMVMEKRSGLFLVWALRDVVAALASAAFLCAFIYLAYMHFQRRIDRRKARWDYFCSRVREQLSNE